jgi:hypothetical protein
VWENLERPLVDYGEDCIQKVPGCDVKRDPGGFARVRWWFDVRVAMDTRNVT